MCHKAANIDVTRRDFVRLAMGTLAMMKINPAALAVGIKSSVPYRTLGRTGEKVSMVGLGGYHIGMQKDEQESIRIIRTAIDNGINFLDNSWDYNGGASEIREGKALRDGYRAKAFLMTKIDGRTKKSAEAQINESLRRLQTDYVDLMQFHEVIRMRQKLEEGTQELRIKTETGRKLPQNRSQFVSQAKRAGGKKTRQRFLHIIEPPDVCDVTVGFYRKLEILRHSGCPSFVTGRPLQRVKGAVDLDGVQPPPRLAEPEFIMPSHARQQSARMRRNLLEPNQ